MIRIYRCESHSAQLTLYVCVVRSRHLIGAFFQSQAYLHFGCIEKSVTKYKHKQIQLDFPIVFTQTMRFSQREH